MKPIIAHILLLRQKQASNRQKSLPASPSALGFVRGRIRLWFCVHFDDEIEREWLLPMTAITFPDATFSPAVPGQQIRPSAPGQSYLGPNVHYHVPCPEPYRLLPTPHSAFARQAGEVHNEAKISSVTSHSHRLPCCVPLAVTERSLCGPKDVNGLIVGGVICL